MENINKSSGVYLFSLILILFAMMLSGNSFSQDKITITGTVKYLSFEGGFYGIAGDDGKNYEPRNLIEEFQEDGLKVKVTGKIRTDVMSYRQWGEILEITDIEIASSESAVYEAYEWGVMAGCYGKPEFFNTSRPEQVMYVKLPVIYIHSKEEFSFDLTVNLKNGKPTDTYPKTCIIEPQLKWENVKVIQGDIEKDIYRSKAKDFVPLESIIEPLNNVDAPWLQNNNVNSKFLFYEGEMTFDNKVIVDFNTDMGEVMIRNNFDYPVYNVVVSSQKGDFLRPEYVMCRVEKLAPGEAVGLKFLPQEYDVWLNDLIMLGFTEMEAKSFDLLWKNVFLERTNTGGWANLIYRLPEEIVNNMIPAKFEPEPQKFTRVLYNYIHLDELQR
ncbi:MAG: hypothetical protein JW917_05120 [Ignavibacteria bacterium]|nr:hypothetical protein [Ignavibacteria bacterium]